MPKPLPDDIRAALAGGRKIDAIRLLRERTGLGLAQAKAAVESGSVPDAPAPPQPGLAGSLPAEVQAALAGGNLLQAIKLLRQTKGVSLKQAKALADEAKLRADQQGVQRGEGLSPGEVPRTRLRPALVVALILLAGAAWVAFGSS